MWIKSALMTMARPEDNQGLPIQRAGQDATPLDYGSGHVRARQAFDPGVVYDSSPNDWVAYGCALGQVQLVTDPGFCDAFGTVDPSDLNYPSIGIGDIAGAQRVTRTLTNITTRASRYRARVQVPPGFRVRVAPARLTIPPGQSRTFRITFTRMTAALGEWSFGAVTWRDQRGHVARSPIALRPVGLAAPDEVAGTGTSGSTVIGVTAGYAGTLTASVAGLQAATVTPLPLTESGPDFDPDAPAASSRTGVVPLDVPAGTPFLRVATYDADYPAGTDVDLFVYRVEGTTRVLVGQSSGSTSDETITLRDPAAASYEAYVSLFGANTPTLTVQPHSWVLSPTAAGNLTVAPASQSVTTAGQASVTATWSGLTAGTRYLGMVGFGDGTSEVGRTLVTVQ
jgi:hypothetical protein